MSQRQDERVIEREELYEAIWAEPATTVAARYSITSTALAKICRKLNVPTPPRGYWARKAAGQSPRKTKLLAPRTGQITRHWITATTLAPTEVLSEAELVRPEIAVPASVSDLHPLVQRYAGRLRRNKSNIWARTECIAIRVSDDQLDRALRIMHALVTALEATGATITVSRPVVTTTSTEESRTIVVLDGIRFSLSLHEETRREAPHDLAALAERARWTPNMAGVDWLQARHELRAAREAVRHVPSGQLAITFTPAEHVRETVQRAVRDTKRAPLEDRLGVVIVQMRLIVRLLRDQHERDVAETTRREEEARARAERERVELREKRLREDLLTRYDAFGRVERILALVHAVETNEQATPSAKAWAKWARGRADAMRAAAIDVDYVWDNA